MITVNEKRALKLVTELMAIQGVSCEEKEVATFIVDQLLASGIAKSSITYDTAHRRTLRGGQVGNLIVKLPGTVRAPRVMLSAHMDTVPICVGCRPKRTGQVISSSNRTTGLGADDRAGVAAILTAALELVEESAAHVPLTLCFFVQEEIGLQGSRHMSVDKLGQPKFAVNFDGGSASKLTIGATGGERIYATFTGLAAHAGLAPEKGASAIEAASIAIANLKRSGWLGLVRKKGSLGTSNVGVVHGGNATNVVCDKLEVQAEARSHDGEFREKIASAICDAFVAACQQVVSSEGTAVSVDITRRVDYEAFRLDENSPLVQMVCRTVKGLGGEPNLAISNGGVDANWLVKHGIPAVTLGCGQRDVHTSKETLDIPDFLLACRVAKAIAAGVTEDTSHATR